MVKKFNEFINESIIDDILTRNKTGKDKKEDDINILNIDEFTEYMKKFYNCQSIDRTWNGLGEPMIFVPVFGKGFNSIKMRVLFKKDNITIDRIEYPAKVVEKNPGLVRVIKDNFKLISQEQTRCICPKSGIVDNRFCMDVINTIICNVNQSPLTPSKELNIKPTHTDITLDNFDTFKANEPIEYALSPKFLNVCKEIRDRIYDEIDGKAINDVYDVLENIVDDYIQLNNIFTLGYCTIRCCRSTSKNKVYFCIPYRNSVNLDFVISMKNNVATLEKEADLSSKIWDYDANEYSDDLEEVFKVDIDNLESSMESNVKDVLKNMEVEYE